jgi:hypothetical protein
MPRFFFHLRDQECLHEDTEGMDLTNLHAALSETLRSKRELADEPLGRASLEFEIADSSRQNIIKVPICRDQQGGERLNRLIAANSHQTDRR